MASKGRKAQAAAARKAEERTAQTARPIRQILPTIGRNNLNGTNAQNLSIFRVHARPLTWDEVQAWDKLAAPLHSKLGTPAAVREAVASELLVRLVKETPATITFLPTDPAEDWDSATGWFATTGPPNYTPAPGQQVRELNPEKTSQGATPLLAALALIEARLAGKIWAWAGKAQISGDPALMHYEVVAQHYKRNGLPFD